MTPDEMRAVLAEHLANEARHDGPASASTYTEDGSYANHAIGLRFEGREAVAMQYTASFDSMPDMKATYHAELVGADVVVQLGTVTATVVESFVGVPASGRVRFEFLAVNRFRDGRMAGEELFFDLADVCGQLGIDPADVRANAAALRGTVAAAL